jgi:ABC-type Fe3+-hydroxamate transport system substrate-binding protein
VAALVVVDAELLEALLPVVVSDDAALDELLEDVSLAPDDVLLLAPVVDEEDAPEDESLLAPVVDVSDAPDEAELLEPDELEEELPLVGLEEPPLAAALAVA